MKKTFWILFFLAFVSVDVLVVDRLVLFWLESFPASQMYDRAALAFDISSYFFLVALRALPFVILGIIALKSGLTTTTLGRCGIWFLLLLVAGITFWGYWDMRYLWYSQEKISSTTSISYISIPIWATLLSVVSYFIFALCSLLMTSIVRKNKHA